MISPFDIQEIDINKDKEKWNIKIPLYILEYIIRIAAAIIVSITCIIVSLMPSKVATRYWINILRMYVNMFEAREKRRKQRWKHTK